MRKIFILFIVIAFLCVIFNFNDIMLVDKQGDYYWYSVPYAPLAVKTDYTCSYAYLNDLGGSVIKSYNTVYIQAQWQSQDADNGDFGGAFGRPGIVPIGWVFICFNTGINESDIHIEDVDIFTYNGGDLSNGLNRTNVNDAPDDLFSKPFEEGAIIRNNVMYYAKIDGWELIDKIQFNLSQLDSPNLPSKNDPLTEYFYFVIEELVYFTECISAVFSAFGSTNIF